MDKTWKETSLPALEREIQNYWSKNSIPQRVKDISSGRQEKRFLDGPPFATGTLHYGHLLVSTIKDLLARFFTMNGFYVDRQNGWDCHGVPIEMLAKKHIGYKTKKELLEYGISKHNDLCRTLVSNCTEQWYSDFERMGRWVDRSREYRTMDLDYMESVIWVFSDLFKKGMIFEGYKILPYSTGCATALSHFEAKQNYKTITETSAIVCFEIVSTEHSVFKWEETEYSCYLLAWTTTPWTLPANMALCTGIDIEIVQLFDSQMNAYILLSKTKYEQNYAKSKRFRLVKRIVSYDLINVEYKPPFTYFWNPEEKGKTFRVVADHYVKENGDAAGTGFVHLSPCHGEEDYRVCCQNNIIDVRNSKKNMIDVIDDDGCFVPSVTAYAGKYVKDADPLILKDLKAAGLLFDSKPYTHSYPFCYRTDTPLLYKRVPGWFLNASNPDFRNKMIANNNKVNWEPAAVGSNHFGKWIQDSVDWCVSRNRYWGTPIPVWKSDDEVRCFSSIAELAEAAGVKSESITDLHIETLDKLEILSSSKKPMKRVDGVLDCWFESGAVPYGQLHYPFQNKTVLDNRKGSISDFITESKDQTRGWFYTLNVLSTALFDKPAFENVIVTGIVNGSDGEKMSKSKGNYTNPTLLLDKYGADVVRLYLLSTPVVKSESIRFDEVAVGKLQQNTTVKLYNITLMFVEKAELFKKETRKAIVLPLQEDLSDIADLWIINKTGLLLKSIHEDLSAYRVHNVASKLICYIEQLTNWYVKLVRERLKGNNGECESWEQSLQTLLFVLYNFCKIAAPIMPFITETIYLMILPYLKDVEDSVHLLLYPDFFKLNVELERKFEVIQTVITLVRELRSANKINNRRPLCLVEIDTVNPDDWTIIQDILDYAEAENVLKIKKADFSSMILISACPNSADLSAYLKDCEQIKNMKAISNFITNLTPVEISVAGREGTVTEPTTKSILPFRFIFVRRELKVKDPTMAMSNGIVVRVNTSYTEEVQSEYLIKLVNRAIQMHRKQMNMKPWQVIGVEFNTDPELADFIQLHSNRFLAKNVISVKFKNVEPVSSFDILEKHKLHLTSSFF